MADSTANAGHAMAPLIPRWLVGGAIIVGLALLGLAFPIII